MSHIIVTYRVISDKHDVSRLARKIAIEQSVETPQSIITASIEARFVGRVEQISALHNRPGVFTVTLSYPQEILSRQYNQLINLCFGNVSMYQNIRLIDITIPDDLLEHFPGPGFGVEGIRRMLGVYGRPLLATALKPRGYTHQQFAHMAYQFALGGGDIIKDDQNLVGSFADFQDRVTLCLRALKKAQDKTGRSCLYFPFISAPFEELEKYFQWVATQQIPGVLLAPLIMGLDTARGWAAKYNLIYMAHPSFSGSYCVPPNNGMSYELLYGTLFRLAGVDIAVYPNAGGRFQFAEKDCQSIAAKLLNPLGKIKAALPCPAGGMQYEDLNKMCRQYGKDAVFLLGGSLLEYAHDPAIATRAFRDKITASFNEKPATPALNQFVSSCEAPLAENTQLLEHLLFDNFQWQGRDSLQYKDCLNIPFQGMRRVELVGRHDEPAKFDLRYFEIEQNGYSSKEKHRHVHVIIIARGQGVALIEDRQYRARKNDIFYIKPNAVHQLKNTLPEPFGFYCIVDRLRDKPVGA